MSSGGADAARLGTPEVTWLVALRHRPKVILSAENRMDMTSCVVFWLVARQSIE
jgi:hypothetical protein